MDGWMIVHRREDNAFLNSLNTYHSVCIFRLGNCDPITQTSPAQLEDPPVKNVKKWVPLLGVRLLLLAFGRIFQIWRNNLSQVSIYSKAMFLTGLFWLRENVMLDFIPKHLPLLVTLTQFLLSSIYCSHLLDFLGKKSILVGVCQTNRDPPESNGWDAEGDGCLAFCSSGETPTITRIWTYLMVWSCDKKPHAVLHHQSLSCFSMVVRLDATAMGLLLVVQSVQCFLLPFFH